jgi:hypothetical protein
MTESNQASGTGDQSGGAENQQQQQEPSNSEGNQSQDDSVNRKDHQRALDDMHKFKGQVREYQAKLDEAMNQIETMKSQGLKEKEDWKTLYESTKSKLDETNQAKERLRESVFSSERYKAIYPALKKAGLRDDAENLVDLHDWGSDLQIEVTSAGRFQVDGVDSAVDLFKAKYPYAFANPKAPRVNGATGSSAGLPPATELTPEKLIEIERQCRKKGDMKPYHEARLKYRQMKRS